MLSFSREKNLNHGFIVYWEIIIIKQKGFCFLVLILLCCHGYNTIWKIHNWSFIVAYLGNICIEK